MSASRTQGDQEEAAEVELLSAAEAAAFAPHLRYAAAVAAAVSVSASAPAPIRAHRRRRPLACAAWSSAVRAVAAGVVAAACSRCSRSR